MQETHLIPGWGRSPGEGRKWQPTPVFLPGKYHGQRSLAGQSPWGHKELDMSKQKTKLAYYNKKDFLFTSLSKTQIYALYESHTKNNMDQKKN